MLAWFERLALAFTLFDFVFPFVAALALVTQRLRRGRSSPSRTCYPGANVQLPACRRAV